MDGQLPPEIDALLRKAVGEGLTAAERATLENWARDSGDPDIQGLVNDLVAKSPPVASDPASPHAGTRGSWTDVFSEGPGWGNPLEGFAQALEGPYAPDRNNRNAGIVDPNLPTWELGDVGQGLLTAGLSGPSSLEPTGQPSVSERVNQNQTGLPIIEAPQQIPGQTASGSLLGSVSTNQTDPYAGAVPADRGGQRDRNQEDWATQVDSLFADTTRPVDPSSAFAGVDLSNPEISNMLANSPGVAAQLLAESRNPGIDLPAGSRTAEGLAPSMAGAMQLASMGMLTKGRDIHTPGPGGSAETLQQAEDWLNQAQGNGVQIDPRSIYKRAFKRIRHTDINSIGTPEDVEAGLGGDLQTVINTTNGYMAAAAPFMTDQQKESLGVRLAQASRQYMLDVAKGTIDPNAMTYPQYLKSIKAQRWLGR